MNCRLSEDYMMKYFDGELNDIEKAQMKQHLKSCSKCSKEYEELKGIINFLESESIIEPPEDFEAQVMQKVEMLETDRKSRKARWTAFLYNFAAVTSAVLFLLIAAYFNEVDAVKIAERIGEYFNYVSGLAEGLRQVLTDGYDITESVMRALYQVTAALFKTYYYIFIALMAWLLAVQKTFFTLVKQGGGNKQ